MIRKEKNKSQFTIIGSLLILGAIVVFISYYSYSFFTDKNDSKKVDEFINNTIIEESIADEEVLEQEEEKVEVKEETYNYIGVLEIPKINLKRGFFDIDDKNNHVNKNIEVLQNSDMPNVSNGLLAIAGHSGSGITAYFRNLHKLKVDDHIYIYYDNVKYIYQVVKYYEEDKNGVISIEKYDVSTLVLTTCSPTDDNKQLVVLAKLINKTEY